MSAKLLPGDYTGSKLEAYKEEQADSLTYGEEQSSQDGQKTVGMQELKDAVCNHKKFDAALENVLLKRGSVHLTDLAEECAKALIETLHN